MEDRELLSASYEFVLPQRLIASHPANPRDSAKLLVYNRADGTITHDIFSHLALHIPPKTAIVFNDTKVIKARLFGKKTSGGAVELLINRALNAFEISVYIKGRVKVGSELLFDDEVSAKVVRLDGDGSRVVEFFSHGDHRLRFEELLLVIDKIGHIPLPPYLGRDDESSDESEYQSVFAHYEGAVAAPTASLHFTDELHRAICTQFEHAYLTLHVGSGTFKPVECDNILEHPMHSEYYSLGKDAKELIFSTKKILAIGTTATRTVEFFVRNDQKMQGEANLFLHPQNRPQRVDYLLTNFHLPKSTLLMLVASFVGLDATHLIYKEAIEKEYRFYSYGDAMLIL